MEFRLANGSVITDEDIERECAEYESGSWEGDLVNRRMRDAEVEVHAPASYREGREDTQVGIAQACLPGIGVAAGIERPVPPLR